MKKLYLFAEQFEQSVKKEASIFKFAERASRKDIENNLTKSKRDYNQLKMSVDGKKSAAEKLKEEIIRDSEKLTNARKYLDKAYEVLKNMDLSDCNEVRFIGDDVGYVKNKRIYAIKVKDNEIHLVPFKKRNDPDEDDKKDKESEETNEDANEDDDKESEEDFDKLYETLFE